jgi:hypothetical protein
MKFWLHREIDHGESDSEEKFFEPKVSSKDSEALTVDSAYEILATP